MPDNLALKTINLCRRFGSHLAVKGVCLELRPREVCCLIGPNGAGKTTLIRMLCGDVCPSDGRIEVFGVNVTRQPPFKFARRGVLRKYQHSRIFAGLTVQENIDLGFRQQRRQSCWPYGEIVEMLGLGDVQAKFGGELAHGFKQRVEIAMLMASDPKVLLLDEPGAGLSPDEIHDLAKVIAVIATCCAVLLVDHNMRFISQIDSRTIVLHQGAILVDGPFEWVRKDRRVAEIYLGNDV